MGVLSIDILAQANQPPNSIGWLSKSLGFSSTHVFTHNDFTVNMVPVYADPENDDIATVKILSIPQKGWLKIRNVFCQPGFEIPIQDIVDGELTYLSDSTYTTGYSDSLFEFTIRDVGSMTYSLEKGNVTFLVEGNLNAPPEYVGDGSQDIYLGESYTFTESSLRQSLSPPYSDPEGNPPYRLKIVSIPLHGSLELDDVPVVENQEIEWADIVAQKLVYKNQSLPGGDIEGFEFMISDTGSQKYRG